VVISGLGSLGIKVEALIDNDLQKHCIRPDGIPVIGLTDLVDKKIPIIIATTRFTSSITSQLQANENSHVIPYSVMSLMDSNLFPDEIPYVGIQNDFSKNTKKYLELFLLLEDDKSRRVLDSLVGYRLNYDSFLAKAVSDGSEKQYFDEEMLSLEGGEIFADLGGFDGDTVEKFIGISKGNYEKIYLFEPDKNLIRKAASRLAEKPSIEYISSGAYSLDGELRFSSSGGTNGSFTSGGEIMIPVCKLDTLFEKKKHPTIIKMDIEGAEAEALVGASEILKISKPKIAIAAYHMSKDLWYLPEVVRGINPEYRFFLRHYTETGLEIVIYAI
jgi:FkbM family methyltransferase